VYEAEESEEFESSPEGSPCESPVKGQKYVVEDYSNNIDNS